MLGMAERWAPPLRITPLFVSRFVPVPGPEIGPGGPWGGELQHPSSTQYTRPQFMWVTLSLCTCHLARRPVGPAWGLQKVVPDPGRWQDSGQPEIGSDAMASPCWGRGEEGTKCRLQNSCYALSLCQAFPGIFPNPHKALHPHPTQVFVPILQIKNLRHREGKSHSHCPLVADDRFTQTLELVFFPASLLSPLPQFSHPTPSFTPAQPLLES